MELNTILDIMSTFNLTADELLLVYLTLIAQDEENHPEYLSRWLTNGNQSKLKILFESLKQKEVIKKNYNPSSYIPNEIEFNQHFIKSYFKHSKKMGKELFDNYEPFILINGKHFSLRNITKKFFSLEEFYFFYSRTICHSVEKHNEIMELLKWGRDNKLIRCNMLEFVASHKWNELKFIKEQGIQGDSTSTYDLYEDL